jgi:Rrf2 family protein
LVAIRRKMKLSSKTKYGLKACHFLGINYPDNTVSASTLENYVSVSGKYLEKIMRMLSTRNIVCANRGASGGYYLARPPKEITVGEIVRALEDDIEIIECVKEDGKCKCCPSSGVWKRLYKGINDLLDSMTLEQMIKGELQ